MDYEYTEQELIDWVENELGNSTFFSACRDANCDVNVEVAVDMMPYLVVDTNRNDISIEVETRIIESSDGEQGYEFIPHIETEMVDDDFDLETADDLLNKFNTWAKICKVCDMIYNVEFYPDRYID